MSMVNLNVRVDAEVKQRAEALFNSLGLNMSTAVNVFLRQSLEADGLPFAVRHETPNQVTLDAMRDTVEGRNLSRVYHNTDEMWADLERDEDA